VRTELPASAGGQSPCLNAGAAALLWPDETADWWPDETADWWLDETAETAAFSWAAFTELPASAGGQSPCLRTGSLLLAAAPSASLFAARAEAAVVAGKAAAVVVADEAAAVVVADEAAAVVVADEAAAVVVADEAALQLLEVEVWWPEEVISTFVDLYGVSHGRLVVSWRESPQRRRNHRAMVSTVAEFLKSA
jgi:hypothetical protein